jgi:hypothetical protein
MQRVAATRHLAWRNGATTADESGTLILALAVVGRRLAGWSASYQRRWVRRDTRAVEPLAAFSMSRPSQRWRDRVSKAILTAHQRGAIVALNVHVNGNTSAAWVRTITGAASQ